ncbi:hypothetical protein EI42_03204 [Thermosporothrix hazakensis]|jgi:hypothetical protein|uniref:Uncharacterized protein n=1 Tax=Thermosporothrix hazakensis TaxID=644383 RepID=A0A326U6M1_THEHA|nr:hypothetical protein EI42_03204 [Thermosporothrix hazakensis]
MKTVLPVLRKRNIHTESDAQNEEKETAGFSPCCLSCLSFVHDRLQDRRPLTGEARMIFIHHTFLEQERIAFSEHISFFQLFSTANDI